MSTKASEAQEMGEVGEVGEVGNRASEHMKEEGESDFAVDAARGIGPARNHQANRKSPIAPMRDASRTRRLRLTSFSTTTVRAPATFPRPWSLPPWPADGLVCSRVRVLAASTCIPSTGTISNDTPRKRGSESVTPYRRLGLARHNARQPLLPA